MNKILKTISFLLLSVCFMLKADIAYATKDPICPRESLHNHCEKWKNDAGTDFETFQYHHDETKIFADEQNKQQDTVAAATAMAVPAAITAILAASGVGAPLTVIIGGASTAGTALGNLIFKNIKTHGQQWLDSSTVNEHCGVKVHYWRDIFGIWHYYGFDPQ